MIKEFLICFLLSSQSPLGVDDQLQFKFDRLDLPNDQKTNRAPNRTAPVIEIVLRIDWTLRNEGPGKLFRRAVSVPVQPALFLRLRTEELAMWQRLEQGLYC